MKNTAALIALLALVACAKARKMPEETAFQNTNPVQTTKEASTKTEDNPVITKPIHTGKVLTINSTTDAVLKFKNKDARNLYESLQLKKFQFKDDKGEIINITKRGFWVYCEEKLQPEELFCQFLIDPSTGKLKNQNNSSFTLDFDPSVIPVLTRGSNYNVSAKIITMMIKGRDARALYDSIQLKPIETESENGETRTATKGFEPLLSCTETMTDEAVTYKCSFTLRVNDGGFPTKDELFDAKKVEVVETVPAIPPLAPAEELVPAPISSIPVELTPSLDSI